MNNIAVFWTKILTLKLLNGRATHHDGKTSFCDRWPSGHRTRPCFGRAEKIAALAVFLADENAGFMTGQAPAIDGGWAIRPPQTD